MNDARAFLELHCRLSVKKNSPHNLEEEEKHLSSTSMNLLCAYKRLGGGEGGDS